MVDCCAKSESGKKRKGEETYNTPRCCYCSPSLFAPSFTIIRDLKIRWRRRQRELQKNNTSRLAKQQLCTCISIICTFLCRHCKTTTRKCLISRFMEDVNKLLWNFLSHSELGYGFSGIQLQKSSPTFDKVIELELSRWRLNEREFSF